MVNLVVVLQVRLLKVLFAFLNAKMMSYWTVKETAIVVELIKLFLMENVFAILDILLTLVEFASFRAEEANSYSKEHAQLAH
jgi:hypothetical protein